MPIKVNDELIDDALVKEEARTIRPRLFEAMADEDPAAVEARVKEWSRENVIERTLLRQAAMADPEPVDPATVEEWLTKIRNETPGQSGCIALGADDEVRRDLEARLKVDRLLEKITAKTAKPANKEIAEHYRKNRESYVTPELVHAAHIVKNVDEKCDEATARAAIEEAERELAAGADFAELADRLSDCPGRGGDLGFFPRGEMVDEFEAHAFSLPVGVISPIFRSPFGFHILKVLARRPEGVRDLSDVRAQIEEQLWQEKKQKTIEQYLDRLWAKAKIEDQPA